jgi:hypothetical protein
MQHITDIDQLNRYIRICIKDIANHKNRIENLEAVLDEEVSQRKEDHATNVQERKTHELEITTVIDEGQEVGNADPQKTVNVPWIQNARIPVFCASGEMISCPDMARETEMLR